jgi:hypothetical protein
VKTRFQTLREHLATVLLLVGLLALLVVAVAATAGGGTANVRSQAQIKPSVTGRFALGMSAADRLRATGSVGAGGVFGIARAPASSGTSSTPWIVLAAFAAGPLIVLGAFVRERLSRRSQHAGVATSEPSLQGS